MDHTWPFSDPPNTMAFVSRRYFQSDAICHVYHAWSDGSWTFLPDCVIEDSDAMIVCLAEVMKKDLSIGQLSALPYGWKAERLSPSAVWTWSKDHPYPVHAEHGYYLDDATVYEELYPDQYSIPDKTMRDNLPVGQVVKLIFRFAAEMAERQNNECERMWVEVLEVDTDYGRYRGRLLNQPKRHTAISEGHELWFHPIHVFAIDDTET